MPDSNEPQNRPEGKTVYRPADPDTPDIPLADDEPEQEEPRPITPPKSENPPPAMEFPDDSDDDEGPIELDPG